MEIVTIATYCPTGMSKNTTRPELPCGSPLSMLWPSTLGPSVYVLPARDYVELRRAYIMTAMDLRLPSHLFS